VSNLYPGHDEWTVHHKMQEVNHAVEQARLFKEAGLSGTRPLSLLARGAKALRNLLKTRGERVENHPPLEQESYLRAEETEC